MTTPTPAQIEAGIDDLIARLRKAADALPPPAPEPPHQLYGLMHEAAYALGRLDVALHHATQVGETNQDWIEKRKAIRQSAIERCAQVVDEKLKEHDGLYGCGPYARAAIKSTARAIRKLKEEV